MLKILINCSEYFVESAALKLHFFLNSTPQGQHQVAAWRADATGKVAVILVG